MKLYQDYQRQHPLPSIIYTSSHLLTLMPFLRKNRRNHCYDAEQQHVQGQIPIQEIYELLLEKVSHLQFIERQLIKFYVHYNLQLFQNHAGMMILLQQLISTQQMIGLKAQTLKFFNIIYAPKYQNLREMNNKKLLDLVNKQINQQSDQSSGQYDLQIVPTQKQPSYSLPLRKPEKTERQTKMDIFLSRATSRTQQQKQKSKNALIIQQPIPKIFDRYGNFSQKLVKNAGSLNREADLLALNSFERKHEQKNNKLQGSSSLFSSRYSLSTTTNNPQIYSIHQPSKKPIYTYPQAQSDIYPQSYSRIQPEKYSYNYQQSSAQQKQEISLLPSLLLQRKKKIQEEKKIKKQKLKEENKERIKKKKQQERIQMMQGFSAFVENLLQDKTKKKQNNLDMNDPCQLKIRADDKLKNLEMYDNMLEENTEKNGDEQPNRKFINIFKKKLIQQEKVPKDLIRILLSFKFSENFLIPETKKVPNTFTDQLTYKRIFHYLVTNQCLADLHLRMKKLQTQENKVQPIPIKITFYTKNSDGLITVNMSQIETKRINQRQEPDKQKFMLKNLWLSRNRIGIVTNCRKLQIGHFGVPSPKDQKVFCFLCFLVTPESKQQLNGEVKGLASFQTSQLDMILKVSGANRAYFHDLEKISTHIRQYFGISHLYQTEVAPLIYNPLLIDRQQYDMIPENERSLLEPILSRLEKQYNKTQYRSIRQMTMRNEGIVLLQGPPGTGKTTTLMGLLAAEYHYFKFVSPQQQSRKILICAPSNAAIDHITKRIVCQGLMSTDNCRIFPNILRVGIVETQDQDIRSVSLDDICDKKVLQAKKINNTKNNMTHIQIKQKIVSLNKSIVQTQTKNRNKPQQDYQLTITRLKREIKQYESMLYAFRKQKIQMKQIYLQEEKKLFDEADIILTTLSSSGSDRLQKLCGYFGCLIVDEAAQSTEPNLLIPLQTFVKKVLLIGDPCQLPSTTLSMDSQITLFNRSLFERFIDSGVKPYFLNIQYRMASMIRQFPSDTFYQGRLLDDKSINDRYKMAQKIQNTQQDMQFECQKRYKQKNNKISESYEEGQIISNKSSQSKINIKNPLMGIKKYWGRNSLFIDVKFGVEEFYHNSYRNLGEGSVVSYLLSKFLNKTKLTIGVITPYNSQKKQLLKTLHREIQLTNKRKRYEEQKNNRDLNLSKNGQSEKKQSQINQQSNKTDKSNSKNNCSKNNNCDQDDASSFLNRTMINTIDSFQGQEKDIIIISTVRANSKNDIGFIKDQRRINVALTRCRHLLIIVGNADTLGSNEIWDKMLNWYEEHSLYYCIKEKDDMKKLYNQLESGNSTTNNQRKRYSKLSKDLRRIQRNEIKSQDFGLGAPTKKYKKDKNYHNQNSKKSIEERLGINKPVEESQEKIQKNSSQNINNFIDESKNPENNRKGESQQQFLEQKQKRENQAIKLQQINKRLKQLQMKMIGENSSFAQLFK